MAGWYNNCAKADLMKRDWSERNVAVSEMTVRDLFHTRSRGRRSVGRQESKYFTASRFPGARQT